MSAILKLYTPTPEQANEKAPVSTAMPTGATTAARDTATTNIPRRKKRSKAAPPAPAPAPSPASLLEPLTPDRIRELMPRGVWYRAQNDTWYSESLKYVPIFGKRQIKLVQGFSNWQQAITAHENVLAKCKAGSASDDVRIDHICEQYLEAFEKRHERGRIAKVTFTTKRWSLRLFCQRFGKLTMAEFANRGKEPVFDWLHSAKAVSRKGRAFASTATQRKALKHIMAAFNWAVNERRISANPLKGIEMPPENPRTQIYTHEQEAAILERFASEADTSRFLFAISRTGCRPFVELAKVRGSHIEWSGGEPGKGSPVAWRFPKPIKGRQRTVYLDPQMSELTASLYAQHGDGLLFVRDCGKPFSPTLGSKYRREVSRLAAERPELKLTAGHAVLYTWRHTLIARLLRQPGMDVQFVADQMGNSIKMISECYAKYGITRTDTMARLAALRQ